LKLPHGAYVQEGISGHDYLMTKTGGRRVEIEVDGKSISCTTIGGLAAALGRTSHLVRCWERSGLIPPAPFILPGGQNTKRRLYPISLVAAIHDVAIREGFGRRRPSGRYLRQQQMLYNAWNAALASLTHGEGVTEGVSD
jgi:hypothetical protein